VLPVPDARDDGPGTGATIRHDGVVACSSATVESDRWVPLMVEWDHDGLGLVRLVITDPRGGFVELCADPDSGVLCRFVVINLPPRVVREPEAAAVRSGSVPVLDRRMWPAEHDYDRAWSNNVDFRREMAYSVDADRFTVWISRGAVAEHLQAGSARIGVSSAGDLVSVDVPAQSIDEIWWED
jgi:hypothetical protein